MIVYWKQKVSPNIKVDEDKYGNPIYQYEEVFGEVIGAWTNSNGSNGEKLIVALPNGKLDDVIMSNCYHKTTIVDGNAIDKLFENCRVYGSQGVITNKDDVYTVEEWEESVFHGDITDDDGMGYWVKDNYISLDDVFSTDQLNATHVIWFNK